MIIMYADYIISRVALILILRRILTLSVSASAAVDIQSLLTPELKKYLQSQNFRDMTRCHGTIEVCHPGECPVLHTLILYITLKYQHVGLLFYCCD